MKPAHLLEEPTRGGRHLGWLGLLTALLTVATFAVAYTTPPRSGPLCTTGCIPPPYTDAARFVPRDYLWMYPAILVTMLIVVLVVAVTLHPTSPGRGLLGRGSLVMVGIGAGVLILDYGIQLAVVQPMLSLGEADGLGFLTQYHPHGVFIGLEDIGYTALAVGFLLAGAGLTPVRRAEQVIRWVLGLGGGIVVAALAVMAPMYGSDLAYRFELVAISVTWLAVVLVGAALAVAHLRRARPASSRGAGPAEASPAAYPSSAQEVQGRRTESLHGSGTS